MNIQDFARSIISGGKNFIGGLVDEVYEAPILFGESLGKAATSLQDRRSNKLLTDEALRLQQLSKNLPAERQQRLRKTALDLLTEAQGGYKQLAQEAQQYGTPERIIPSAASTALTLLGAPAVTKGGALFATGLGGLIGGLTGGSAAETAGRALGSLPRTMGLVRFTSPGAQYLGGKVGQSLENIGASLTGTQLASRGITGISNVLEDEVLAAANRRTTSTPEKITSFALGALLNPQANTNILEALKDYNTPKPKAGNPYHDVRGKFTTPENASEKLEMAGGGTKRFRIKKQKNKLYENLDNRQVADQDIYNQATKGIKSVNQLY